MNSEGQALFAVLRQSADAACVAVIERLVDEAPDRALSRVNVPALAAQSGLDEQRLIAAFQQQPPVQQQLPAGGGGAVRLCW